MLPQTERFLHGTKVAYGILVQSALLGDSDTLCQLKEAFKAFGLPTTLAALDVDIHDRAALRAVIARTLQAGESIHYLPLTLNEDVLLAAFNTVESTGE